jgi:arabinogalactan endo-1,4-beta-galactosidase
LRVWVDPADGYHEKLELLRMARRAKAAGLKMLVDLHYSDFWADPGRQGKPAAWASYTVEQLRQAVYDYTFDICHSLKAQDTPPDMIQLGNELNAGMLWPDGHTWDPPNWENLAGFLKAGRDAVKACSPDTKIMLHLANGGDNGLYRWWLDNITAQGAQFDVIGASYYGYWHGSLGDLQNNLNDISARYGKDVVVAETAYPFRLADADGWPNLIGATDQLVAGYPATPEGQAANFRDVLSIVRAVPNGRGLGAFYWDATWIAVPGNGWNPADPSSGNAWENQALFDFDHHPLPAMDQFRHGTRFR